MDAFDPVPPAWTQVATHATQFCCPECGASSKTAQQVWVNRRSPVFTIDNRRKWQEFYQCECERAWWAWSVDRPPPEWARPEQQPPLNPFDED